MKEKILTTLLLSAAVFTPLNIQAGPNEDAVTKVLATYLPGTTSFATPKASEVNINNSTKTITVKCNESTAYIPLTIDQLKQLKSDVKAALPQKYSSYKIEIYSGDDNLDKLALFADKKYVKPSEKKRFVTPLNDIKTSKGLDGNNIALWQSHGLYFQNGDEWGWQRPRLYQTCEDLFTQSFVMPYLMPMLENAGAYVMSPRERDTNLNEYIIDNDNSSAAYVEVNGSKAWENTSNPGFAYDGGELHDYDNPFTAGTARQAKAVTDAKTASIASWNTKIDADDDYAVYVSYQTLPNSATDAVYTVNAANGAHKFKINQNMGGGTWIYLGHFPLKAGVSDTPIVELSNLSTDKNAVVSADAVKIGGGMGNVARHTVVKDGDPAIDPDEDYGYNVSGYPRFTEGARYWLQWAGAPDSVYTKSNYQNEYSDDYRSRGYWVNWLAGGSSVLPDDEGLNIPVDLAFAFHSDAGITPNDSVIGTLGIYCTDDREAYTNGTARLAARDLTDLIMTNIVEGVRTAYDPKWTRRGMWNRSYAEARVPEVPTMLLELLSHQNFADMRYGLDPTFRFAVSRGIYKGMLKYLANRDGRDYVVQPLPVHAFAINGGEGGKYTLTWTEKVDSLEPTATPTYYIIEHRPQGGLGFAPIARVTKPEYTLTVDDNDIHSYRIVAGNDGGVSFPSEVLALRYDPSAAQVLIVNGFTRVSGPDSFDYGEIAGFSNGTDPGVGYVKEINLVGEQFEYRRDISWMANEVAGLGASRSNYEGKVVAGNTFDYVALHGEAIAEAGYGFISSSVEAFANSANTANTPKIVDLIMGNQKEIKVGTGSYGTKYKTFTAPLQTRIKEYTQAGGSIFVSGAYIATDLWNNPYSSIAVSDEDIDFAKDVLGYVWRSGKATEGNEAVGVKTSYKMFNDLKLDFNNELSYDCYAVKSPGAIAPTSADKGKVILKYKSGRQPAGTAYDNGNYRTVAIGIPFETMTSTSQRNALMQAVLEYLSSTK